MSQLGPFRIENIEGEIFILAFWSESSQNFASIIADAGQAVLEGASSQEALAAIEALVERTPDCSVTHFTVLTNQAAER